MRIPISFSAVEYAMYSFHIEILLEIVSLNLFLYILILIDIIKWIWFHIILGEISILLSEHQGTLVDPIYFRFIAKSDIKWKTEEFYLPDEWGHTCLVILEVFYGIF